MPRGLLLLAAFTCGNCHRLVETTPQGRPHRLPRRLDWTVGSMTFEAFPHPWIFTCFLRGLCGQKTAAHAPQGLARLPPVRVQSARPPSRAFVKDRQPQNVVIPSRNHGNPHPSRLVSAPDSATRPPEGTTEAKWRNSHAAACVPPAQERKLRARGINEAHRHFGPGLLS